MRKRKKVQDIENRKKNANFLSVASISIGVLSCILCCVSVISVTFSVISILLGIYAIISGGKKYLAFLGMIFATLGFVFSFAANSYIQSFLNQITSL